jgi:hypothetical protein
VCIRHCLGPGNREQGKVPVPAVGKVSFIPVSYMPPSPITLQYWWWQNSHSSSLEEGRRDSHKKKNSLQSLVHLFSLQADESWGSQDGDLPWAQPCYKMNPSFSQYFPARTGGVAQVVEHLPQCFSALCKPSTPPHPSLWPPHRSLLVLLTITF